MNSTPCRATSDRGRKKTPSVARPSEAKSASLVTLAGHRSVGGMRASIYNAMPEAGVDALIAFMADFQKKRG